MWKICRSREYHTALTEEFFIIIISKTPAPTPLEIPIKLDTFL